MNVQNLMLLALSSAEKSVTVQHRALSSAEKSVTVQHRALFTRHINLLFLELFLLHRSRQKSARASPQHLALTFQISPKSVHFWQSYSRTREGRSFAP